jgi:hypothetical protein
MYMYEWVTMLESLTKYTIKSTCICIYGTYRQRDIHIYTYIHAYIYAYTNIYVYEWVAMLESLTKYTIVSTYT